MNTQRFNIGLRKGYSVDNPLPRGTKDTWACLVEEASRGMTRTEWLFKSKFPSSFFKMEIVKRWDIIEFCSENFGTEDDVDDTVKVKAFYLVGETSPELIKGWICPTFAAAVEARVKAKAALEMAKKVKAGVKEVNAKAAETTMRILKEVEPEPEPVVVEVKKVTADISSPPVITSPLVSFLFDSVKKLDLEEQLQLAAAILHNVNVERGRLEYDRLVAEQEMAREKQELAKMATALQDDPGPTLTNCNGDDVISAALNILGPVTNATTTETTTEIAYEDEEGEDPFACF